MKKLFCTIVLLTSFFAACFAQSKYTAKQLLDKASNQGSVVDAINFINSNISNMASNADLRSILYYKGTLQEQLGFYTDACESYVKAAGIGAGDAKDMPKVSSEQLVINAVRTALCSGDYETAETYLNSAVRSSTDQNIIAFVNLYTVWSSLCHADTIEETQDSIALLKAYSQMQSMQIVKSSVLLTLWYLTDSSEYVNALKKEFPKSAEYGIVTGKVQIMSAPFWYFVPRAVHNATETPSVEPSSASVAASKAVTSSTPQTTSKTNVKKQQLGLFREEANANDLINRLKAKGFKAYSYTEKRASGNTYYIVVVDENAEGTMGLKLKDAGFECYPVVD